MMADSVDNPLTSAVAELRARMDPAAVPWIEAREFAGVPVLEARLPGAFRACFTTRLGGHGDGVYSSFNLDASSSDEPSSVEQNRAMLSDAVKRRLVSPKQVHGVRVAGAAEYVQEQPGSECDGLSLHPDIDGDLAALLLFADCVPVVMCGEVDMAVAHGGWRGVLGGIVQQAGRSTMGAPATVVIGPSLGPCCFEVGEDVAMAFARRFGQDVVLRSDKGGSGARVDLWESITRASSELGVQREHVINPRLCTSCNNDLFYSYRKDGPETGRHGCLGWIADS